MERKHSEKVNASKASKRANTSFIMPKTREKEKRREKKVYVTFKYFISRSVSCLPGGLVVRIRGSHPRGPGSIPGLGKVCIDGSVVESSPATRGARVRFPVNADI